MARDIYDFDDSKRDHHYWWSPGAMRFFRTRVCWATGKCITLTDGTPALVFVTSEQGPDGWRGYCIRLHTAGMTATIREDGSNGGPRDFDTRAQAVGALKRWTKAGCPTR